MVTAVIVLVAGTAVGLISNYQPIGIGSTGIQIRTGSRLQIDASSIRYAQDGEFALGLDVSASGPLRVNVTGFDVGTGISMVKLVDQRLGSDLLQSTPFVSFAPRSRPTHVQLVFRFEGCRNFAASTAEQFQSVNLHFRLFGVRRTDTLTLPNSVSISAPDHCPEVSPAAP